MSSVSNMVHAFFTFDQVLLAVAATFVSKQFFLTWSVPVLLGLISIVSLYC